MITREYEITTLVRADWSPDQVKQFVERVKTAVTDNGGTMLHSLDLGSRTTAYDIEKQGRARYWFFNFVQSGDIIHDLERSFRHDEGVLRYLTVKVNEQVEVGVRQAQQTEDLQRLEQYFGVQLLKGPEVAAEVAAAATATDVEQASASA